MHKGRHENIPRENRFCSYCNMHKDEDEFHFLLECPCFSEMRSLYIPKYFYINPTLQRFYGMLQTKYKSLLISIGSSLIEPSLLLLKILGLFLMTNFSWMQILKMFVVLLLLEYTKLVDFVNF